MLKSFAAGRLFGASWGDGPATVLALHGWRRSHEDFAAVFDRPGAPPAVAPDLPGFGAAPPPPEAWGTAAYAAHLVPLFEDKGVLADRVVVLGHSFGGRVAVRLARLVPDRVDRLVLTGVPLLASAGRRPRPAPGYRLGRRLHRMGLVSGDRMEAMRRRYGSPDYRAAEGVMRAVLVGLLADSYLEDMAATRCPVDLVWGAADTEVPLEVAERAQACFPSATLRVLDGVGHLTPTEAPAALLAAVTGAPDLPAR